MKKIVLSVVGLTLAGLSSMSLAAPTEMSNTDMDKVTAGALFNIAVVDFLDSNIGAATATNTSLLALGSLQQASAFNVQSNESHNTVNQH